MTEAEWNRCHDPQDMLDFLEGTDIASDRKLRLFATLCCRQINHLLDARCVTALDMAERFAEGLVGEQELAEAHVWATDAFNEFDHVQEYAAEAVQSACDPAPLYDSACHAAWMALQLVDVGVPGSLVGATRQRTREQECRWLRDLFGPLPLRKAHLDHSLLRWNDGTVVRIAQGIYDERAFDRMPILADALLDAGCDNEDMLAHCRQQEAVHVRGCWVVDLLLGKS